MAKYHINPETGEVGECHADASKKRAKGCPFGGDDVHFTSREAAVAANEERLAEAFDALEGSSKKIQEHDPLESKLKAIYPQADERFAKRLREIYQQNTMEDFFLRAARKEFPELSERQWHRIYPQVEHFMQVDSYKALNFWRYIPGERPHKLIVDREGNNRGTIERREGFYILGARDKKTLKLISFEQNTFSSEDEAVDYLKAWAKQNSSIRTMT